MPDSRTEAQKPDALPLAWGHQTEDIHAGGLEQTLVATEAERNAVSAALGILGCEAIQLRYRLTRAADDGYRLKGRLTADVVQACVVTLAPVHETIDVDIKVEFRPAAELAAADGGPVDLEDDTEFEPIEGTWLNIGRVAFEEIAANLNPYPRRLGAEYVPPATPTSDQAAKSNPFAVLEKLKKPPASDPA